ncbi:MAG TPA: class I SAM-dependent methyltransferase [Puia sp.]|nr:class I SAM-dependent methyltransferase [Puia sp.]
MELEQAIRLIKNPPQGSANIFLADKPVKWADLGCGTGLFTLALAELLPHGSTIYAIDEHADALKKIPDNSRHYIIKIRANFIDDDLRLESLDGLLMANSLHFVKDKTAFIQKMSSMLAPNASILLVEYDTDKPNPWVPYPISFLSLKNLFEKLSFGPVQKLNEVPSKFNRSLIYSAHVGHRRISHLPALSLA